MLRRLVSGILLTSALAFAQQPPALTGEYTGSLSGMQVKARFMTSRTGATIGFIDNPSQGLYSVPIADVKLTGQSLSFNLPSLNGAWIGFVSPDHATLTGTYNQGVTMPLNFTRVNSPGANPASGGLFGASSPTASAVQPAPPAQPVAPPPPAAAPPSHGPAPSPAVSFDAGQNTITVPRPDGSTVLFVGTDVKVQNFQHLNYIIRHQKGGLGRMFERSTQHQGSSMGSTMGGGEEFLREGGGLVYDSGMGGALNVQESPLVLKAKQLSQEAVDAVAEVRKVSGHEGFTPPGYDNLVTISKYRLRSDGSG